MMNFKSSRKPPWEQTHMIPVEVVGISVLPPYQGYVVVLKEIHAERRLPIFIGVAEAQAISILHQGLEYARPLTFDLFGAIVNELGGIIEGIRVVKLEDNTFYAVVTLFDEKGDVHYIDARPSDSIALALKTKAPIFVAEQVMNSAAISPEQMPEADLELLTDLNRKLQEAVAQEEYEEAAKLRDKIQELEKKMGGRNA